ncbi:sigma-54 interaction domain-containing protein [Candidatus Binatus sp.]|uniref:sigma-54 interaction domain-containing protein n=1 Tax=Candidatus Binatus sp. TaxID=2811406 RepID=UPI003BB21168
MRLQEYSANESPVAAAMDNLRADPAAAACDWFSLEQLAHGSERVGGMVVRSAQVRKVLKTISRLSPYKATVLIHGESGTGKELVARALHTLGSAPGGPFVTFNCSNLVETLAESQLFGHVRGAFTDAREDSLGYFRSANGGTLFLDEIGELPLRLQPKLLRAVETHEIQPVGSSRSYSVDIRLVAATNRDLRAMVKAGQFRDDLYYRLNAAAILVPPLRERREAIPAFIAHFIEHYNRLFGKNVKEVSRAALDTICANQWHGNVRELGHAIESAVLMTENDRIDIDDLPFNHDDTTPEAVGVPVDAMLPSAPSDLVEGAASDTAKEWPYSLDAVIREASKLALIRALQATEGNCHRAAELLGVSRYTVYRMLNRFGLAEGRTYRTFRKPTVRRA